MNALETVILELSRLSAKGDPSSARRYIQRFIRRPAPEASPALREELARLLLQETSTDNLTRRVKRATSEAMGSSSFLRVDSDEAQEPILSESVQAELEQVIQERGRTDELHALGLQATRSVLLLGAPGVGKTMTARYLAQRMELPLLVIDLATVMSSLLGQSGQNIRQAIDTARREPSVLFLDEFDALAKRRNDPSDVGELNRIVNVLLLELEKWPSHSLLVAATNHPELLDRAIWRRFERQIVLPLPDGALRQRILADFAARYGSTLDCDIARELAALTEDASGADLRVLVETAIRKIVINGSTGLNDALTTLALDRLCERARTDRSKRGLYCAYARDRLNMTQREIGAKLGLSHVAVGNILKKSPSVGAITQQ